MQIVGKCLPTPSDTRWNGEFAAVRFCNRSDIKPKLNTLIEELKSKLQCPSAKSLQILTQSDFTILSHFIKVMEPMANGLDVMQKEYNSSQGYVLPVLYSMKRRIEQIDETANVARDFKTAMLQAIDNRFKDELSINEKNKDYILASVSLPRIKTNFIEKDDDISYAKSILISECKKIKRDIVEESSCESSSVDNEFLISFAQQRNHRRTSVENIIESEVSYLVDPREDYTMLNEFPHVREVFFMYNTTLSSSAPVERVFSQSLMIFTPRRNRISADHFEKTLLLKHNGQLLQENNVNIVKDVVHPITMAMPIPIAI